MNICTVETAADLRQFIDFPYQFYRNDTIWVPPLRSELRGQFDPLRNPFLQHCEYALFLLKNGEKVIGRVAAFIDTLAVKAWGEPIGLFGYYECSPEPTASQILLETARCWLRERGMKAMRGPWSFVSQEWGAVIEGFEPPPVIMSPYNPSYYNELFTAFGLEKIKDLLVYCIDVQQGYQIPERILTMTNKVATHYGIRTRTLNMKRFQQEVEIINTLSNLSLIHNWGYSPVTEEEVKAMAHDLKPVVHPKAVVFAEDTQGNPIGFAIALPDVNVLLKKMNGRLLPFGWLRLLWGLPRLTQYRMFALGVIPEYHGKAIDSLLYRALYESCYSKNLRMEINYVLEDNAPMNNAILKLDAKPLRKYRVYQRET